jgi:plastocyanin
MNIKWQLSRRTLRSAVAAVAVLLTGCLALADNTTISARVEVSDQATGKLWKDASNVVVWLTSIGKIPSAPAPATDPPPPRLTQKNKHFEPHVLVVPVGAAVEFPNRDPFFHNVFSLFEGKRFDLGLYEAGTTKEVRFDKPGVSYIFCNIHPEMGAVVVAVETPYYAVSNARGELVIPGVPPGRYMLHVWSEVSLPAQLGGLEREITVSDRDGSLGVIRVNSASHPVTAEHKNKYGRDYESPSPSNPTYNPQ